MDLIIASRSNQSHNSQHKKFGVEIRRHEKDFLKALLLPGNIVQVHGPPMVGKSMLVDQVISELQSELGSTCKVHQYCVDCKNITCLEDILERTLESMGIAPASVLPATIDATLIRLVSVLRSYSSCHNIFVFQKCEALRLSGNDRKFLQLVAFLAYQNVSENGKVTVVFTSYVDFLIQGANVKHVYVGMLVNPQDIEVLLRHYSQEVEDLSECVLFCKRFLGFPEGIIRIAEEYLLFNSNSPSEQYLEEIFNNDLELVHLIFTKRLADVFSWLDEKDLLFVYKCQPISFLRTYSEDQLHDVYSKCRQECPTFSSGNWMYYFGELRAKHILLHCHDTVELMFHPLIIYHCVCNHYEVLPSRNKSQWLTRFLSKILKKAEDFKIVTERSPQYSIHWSKLKVLLNETIQRSGDEPFSSLCTIAFLAGKLMINTFPDEAKIFYQDLERRAEHPGLKAALRAHVGNLYALGADIDWQLAEDTLDSAMRDLEKYGLTYFLTWAANKKAFILLRQAKYLESEKYYDTAREHENKHQLMSLEQSLRIPDYIEEEEDLTRAIYEITPLIFRGNPADALKKLAELSSRPGLESHPCFTVFLNNFGLAYEQCQMFEEALKWFRISIQARRPSKQISPFILLVALNNISKLLLRYYKRDQESLKDCEKYLTEASHILSEITGHYYDRATTKSCLAKLHMRKKNYFEAYQYDLEALSIIEYKAQYADYMFEVLLDLAHLRVVLDLQTSAMDRTEPEFSASDLKRSPEDFLQQILSIKESRGGDSFEFHSNYLSACVHGMLVHVGQSRCDFNKYKTYFKQHWTLVEGLRGITNDTKLSILAKYEHFYNYIEQTEFSDITLQEFNGFVLDVCSNCTTLRQDVNKYSWSKQLTDDLASSSHIKKGNSTHNCVEKTVCNKSETGDESQSVTLSYSLNLETDGARPKSNTLISRLLGSHISFNVLNTSISETSEINILYAVNNSEVSESEYQSVEISISEMNPSVSEISESIFQRVVNMSISDCETISSDSERGTQSVMNWSDTTGES
ncbi:hypothetical protein Bpfe_015518 [Biomphalaria pfeifferi]|uniref:Uncharacterized protein n=1 Tax=Biomphalaria pfeifferi TaxID=112525 RepID=A0AAD8BHX7_BIOPF|nr:hypothetical protein Bpfe_015518 [Biomphalaria pfeifferi]